MSSDENSEPRATGLLYSSSAKFYSKKKKRVTSRNNKLNTTSGGNKASSTSSDDVSDHDDKRQKEKTKSTDNTSNWPLERPVATTTTSNSDQLVLIKYKQSPDDPYGHNSLRANQLQKRREIQSLLLFIFILFVTIITLSQILVMHSQTSSSNFQQVKLMQEELKLMDASIDRMLKEEHVLPISVWVAIKQYNDNLRKFANYMSDYVNSSDSGGGADGNYTSIKSNSSSLDIKSVLFDFSMPNSDETSVDLNSIAASLLNQLKNCSKSQVVLANNDDDNEHSKSLNTSLVKTWSKSSHRAFTHLARHVERMRVLRGDSTPNNINKVEFLNFSQFEPVLNRYLNLTGQLAAELTDKSRENQKSCVQTLFFSLYYYFNAKFSVLFEMYISTRTNQTSSVGSNLTQLDVYKNLMDETVRSIKHNYCVFNKSSTILESTSSNDLNASLNNYWQSVIQNPIRNVNEYVKRYRESKNKFDPRKKLCDPVPPVLCKYLMPIS